MLDCFNSHVKARGGILFNRSTGQPFNFNPRPPVPTLLHYEQPICARAYPQPCSTARGSFHALSIFLKEGL